MKEVHENERVFKDRLTNKPDQNWFNNKCKSLMDKHFKRTIDQVTESAHSNYPSSQVKKRYVYNVGCSILAVES